MLRRREVRTGGEGAILVGGSVGGVDVRMLLNDCVIASMLISS